MRMERMELVGMGARRCVGDDVQDRGGVFGHGAHGNVDGVSEHGLAWGQRKR